jgi:hypothetical protein
MSESEPALNEKIQTIGEWWSIVNKAIPEWKYMTDDKDFRVFNDNKGNVFRIKRWTGRIVG